MDLFNKKKLAALQSELDIAKSELEATSKRLDDLQKNVMATFDELTDYFKPKYVKKYYLYTFGNNNTEYFRCDDVTYTGGVIRLDVTNPDGAKYAIELLLSELKQLKVITKQQFMNKKGDNE